MVDQNEQIVGMDARLLRRPVKEKFRVLDHVLVQRVAARDEERHGCPVPPAGPARLLPGAGDRARIAVDDARLQLADVDAELQRVRADDAEDLAAAQAPLDLPPLLRQIAAAVAADRFAAQLVLHQSCR